jgi:hypothetical protein
MPGMASPRNFKKVLERVQIVRPPKHRLATFGNTQISYLLITDVPGFTDRSRLRTGELKVERPAILTAQALQELFIGFSTEAQSQARC